VVNANGPEWRRLRDLLTPPLASPAIAKQYSLAAADVALELAEVVNKK